MYRVSPKSTGEHYYIRERGFHSFPFFAEESRSLSSIRANSTLLDSRSDSMRPGCPFNLPQMSGSKTHNDHRNSGKDFGKKHENDTNRKRSINRTEISSPRKNVDKAVDHTHCDKYKSDKGTLEEL